MIKYILNGIFTHKRRKIVLGYLLLFACSLFLVLKTDTTAMEQLLHKEYEIYHYNNKLFEFLKFFMPLSIGMLVMEHDQGHIKILVTYFGRKRIHLAKIVSYILVVTILFYFTYLVYVLYAKFFTSFYTTKILIHDEFLYVYLSSLIFLLYLLLCIREKNKLLIFVFVIVNILYSMIQERIIKIELFYLIPLTSSLFKTYKYTLWYQVGYMTLLVLINIHISKKEHLTI